MKQAIKTFSWKNNFDEVMRHRQTYFWRINNAFSVRFLSFHFAERWEMFLVFWKKRSTHFMFLGQALLYDVRNV